MGRSIGSVRLEIKPGFLFLCSMMLLFCGADTALCALIASAVHEGAHWLAAVMFGGRLERICFGWRGLGMRVSFPFVTGYFCDGFCAAAGPAANLILGVCASVPEGSELCLVFAGTNILLGLYNLLPVSGLDGGCLAQAILRSAVPFCLAERLCFVLSFCTAVLMCLPGLWVFIRHGNASLLIFAVALGAACFKNRGRALSCG